VTKVSIIKEDLTYLFINNLCSTIA